MQIIKMIQLKWVLLDVKLMFLKFLLTGNKVFDSSQQENFEMAEILVNHKANLGQAHPAAP